jgi:hypothetical protein
MPRTRHHRHNPPQRDIPLPHTLTAALLSSTVRAVLTWIIEHLTHRI